MGYAFLPRGRAREVFIREMRIIGCTITAAAMKTDSLRSAAPGVILVEEAGEILEIHPRTAVTPNTEQLV